ncbi:ABC transporter substrate-binding protein [Vacuolonema iberomarrocanum]|uniref:ABC transporter substrate-binding protein n=1 Tax=Vacuolonema iberomarrocanum TaxID=3454632 RepID=UPI0019D9FA37|nr:amino acid ABC transporter substrate-binding protein [filamentous cyanobacterium LEGE 07170]
MTLGTGIITACADSTSDSTSAPTSTDEASTPTATSVLETIQERGYFTYGLEAGYRPFEFYDENNELIGYDIDLAVMLGEKWGVESRPTPTNWATVIQSLYDGSFDFILGGMTATEERFERVNFSIPYMDASSGLLIRSDDGIADREDLDGRIVGTKAGTPSIDQLAVTQEELGIQYAEDVRTFPEDTAGIEALRSGRIDAYASSVVSMLEFTKENEGFEVIAFKSERWADEYTCAAFRKEDEDFRTAFNEAIIAMRDDGTLYELQEKWFRTTFEDLPTDAPTW